EQLEVERFLEEEADAGFQLLLNKDEKDERYTELWYACAGPLVNIPHVGDKVFYLPQGHLEQVEAYTNQEFDIQLPKHNLPSQILCRVVYVQLKDELEIDEVFAQVTLLPETKEEMSGIEEETSRSSIGSHSHSFSKIPTASDTSTHGGFSVLKRHADECLPPYGFLKVLRVRVALSPLYSGHPKRHLFTTSWSNYVSSKKLVTGYTFVFLRGENGELRVGVRRAMETQKNTSSSVLSYRSMQLDVLATASQAISTVTMFSVYYSPRMSPPEFLIPYNEYMSLVKNKYSIGLRFRMKFEGEECPKQSLSNWSVLNEKQNKPESREVNIVTKSNSDEFVNSEQLSGPFKMMKRCDSRKSDSDLEKLLQNSEVALRS
ncbi:hypothetical protein MKW98_020454, partial [Papaver atlanticum]